MADVDPWAGLVDPRTALASARSASGTLARRPPLSSQGGYSESPTETAGYDRFSHSSHSSQGAVARKPASQDSRKEEIDLSSSSISETYAIYASPDGPTASGPVRSGDRGPAKPANRLNYGSTHSEHSAIALASPARAFVITNTVPSPTSHLQGPQDWRDGLARLDRWTPPCDGFRPGEWEGIHRVVSHFMDHCAVEAVSRGWSALDLFGVHCRAGAARVDSCGALMLPWTACATLITADAITFGPLVYRRRPMPEAVLVWNSMSTEN